MMVGVDCEQEETTRIHALDMKQLFDAVQDQRFQSPVRRPDEPQGPEVMPDLEDIVSEFDGTTRGMEVMQHSSALIEMWKSLGKNLKQPTYSGQGNANQLMAWQEDVEMLLQVYSVTGEAQVIAAAKFLQGEAEEWWQGLQATGRHRQILTFQQLCKELKQRFFPLDRLERLAKQWILLQQKNGVQEYREEFCLLQAAYPLGERAEFMLAYQGLKPQMKAEIRQALDDEGVEQLPMDKFFVLARKAEVREFRADEVQIVAVKGQPHQQSRRFMRNDGRSNYSSQKTNPLPGGKVETPAKATQEKGSTTDRAGLLREYLCWVCDRKGHFTRDCPDAQKQGCFRCGGAHTLRECPKRLSKVRTLQQQRLGEQEKGDLSYQVQINNQDVQVLVDTGAQCSLIRDDVARRLKLPVQTDRAKEKPNLCGVNGKPLKVRGRVRLICQQAGQTVTATAWVVKGIQNEVILGMPWLQRYQPTISWQERTLTFPTGQVWEPEGEQHLRLKTINRIRKKQDMGVWVTAVISKENEGTRKGEEIGDPQVHSVLNNFAELFEPLQGTPPDQRVKHVIELEKDAKPVMRRPYRLSAAQVEDATEQLQKAIQQGWIQPSQSPWGMPILMVPKKDKKWRLCVDYRDLNAVTVQDAYPLPRIDDLLHDIGASTWFTRLDLEAGYHQIWIHPADQHKTAFRLSKPVQGYSHYEWQVMPFGLRNAPATFQRFMTVVLAPCSSYTIVYMDDVLIHSPTKQKYIEHVTEVFRVFQEKKLKVKKTKCEFFQREISFLGHRVKEGQIYMDGDKREAIKQWKAPLTNAKQVRQFVGLTSYYRMFVPNFSTVMEPLTALTKKRSKFQWTWEADQAMNEIQQRMARAAACWVWQEQRPTRVVTDASGVGVGAILEQQVGEEQGWRMIAAWSRVLSSSQRNYSITDKEWLAVVECVTRVWKHWLLGREFEILTDHAPLREILTKKGENFTYRQLRWFEKLEPYTFRVKYIKGETNQVADALSRTPSFTVAAVEIQPIKTELDSSVFIEAIKKEHRLSRNSTRPIHASSIAACDTSNGIVAAE